ncbi:phosphoribosylanthranilate isomerase [Fulvivirga kasyanovii]|uniref:N-(5'-phosphoribosyl)anthranilate isomerase n=1 Tax=Fulvivirga kasyanovii TaxID=396812 RepID=A0ABW9RR78_9BACT|nr:phosphoribosylanthranilate isomerase [Fulvivirga kasyanovii]MTI25789.1 phosphoribosylanthranilate isomerase [Fulvivirga kasyanovii]
MPKLSNIKLKVCGLRDNIPEVVALKPDFAGFIFYNKSPRYAGDTLLKDYFNDFPESTMKVGVFVNHPVERVLETARQFNLDFVQLHGDESFAECLHLKANGLGVIKVFSGNKAIDRDRLIEYAEVVDYYLFDTRLKSYGGNGVAFDWAQLKGLDLPKPIILSGGLTLENIRQLEELDDLDIYAIDINSQFEIRPGMKNTELIKQLKEQMQ